jgi:hypothetical protein
VSSTLLAADGQYLGKVICSHFDQDSIFNPFGPYGSRFSSTSIWNQFGSYGGRFSSNSPFNQFTGTPPEMVADSVAIGYLTVNQFLTPRLDPTTLIYDCFSDSPSDLEQWLGYIP